MAFAGNFKPPYYAVIFSSSLANATGYDETAQRMVELAATMPGYLGIESARGTDGFGITVSYWRDEEAIANWRNETRGKMPTMTQSCQYNETDFNYLSRHWEAAGLHPFLFPGREQRAIHSDGGSAATRLCDLLHHAKCVLLALPVSDHH